MTSEIASRIDVLASSPGGVEVLRSLILELAVAGRIGLPKVIGVDAASQLLASVAEERRMLLGAGKAKKHDESAAAASWECPCELPDGWLWVSLGALTLQITDGTHHTPTYVDQGVPFISVKDLNGSTVSFEDCRQIPVAEYSQINARCNPERGDILLCRIGTLGRPTIVDTDRAFSLFVSVGLLKMPKAVDLTAYLHLVLKSPLGYRQYERIKAGGSHTNKLNLGDIPKIMIPLPPLSEQQRIVAKVDELMALCDRLEARQRDGEAAHTQLVRVLLDGVALARDADEFRTSWRRLAERFEAMFTTEESIEAAKQAVLLLAFAGNLLPRALDASLGARDRLPDDWREVQIGDIAVVGTGATPARTNPLYFHPPEFSWVTSGETSAAQIETTAQKVSALALAETNLTLFKPGTLIVAMYGQGKTRGQVSELAIEACTNQACAAIQLKDAAPAHRQYVKYFFEKSYDDLRDRAAGGAQPNLNLGKIKSTLIPLPPYDEQKRIVTKITELFILCDRLKLRMAAARAMHAQLAEALVAQAVAA